MGKRVFIVFAAVALVITGVSSQPASGLFSSPKTCAVVKTATDDPYASEEAARHCRCMPRHWRALVVQQ